MCAQGRYPYNGITSGGCPPEPQDLVFSAHYSVGNPEQGLSHGVYLLDWEHRITAISTDRGLNVSLVWTLRDYPAKHIHDFGGDT